MQHNPRFLCPKSSTPILNGPITGNTNTYHIYLEHYSTHRSLLCTPTSTMGKHPTHIPTPSRPTSICIWCGE